MTDRFTHQGGARFARRNMAEGGSVLRPQARPEAAIPPGPGDVRPQGRPSMGLSPVGMRMIQDLQRDFNIPAYAAAGIVGQLAHESGNFETLQEISPTVEGSRGGYGYAQWTGPRRKEFEAFAAENGLALDSYEANYGNLVRELNGPEGKRVFAAMADATDAQQAGRAFTDTFLRPGIPGYSSRDRYSAAYSGEEPLPYNHFDSTRPWGESRGGPSGGGGNSRMDRLAKLDEELALESRKKNAQAQLGAQLQELGRTERYYAQPAPLIGGVQMMAIPEE